jgi:hypothetical protein
LQSDASAANESLKIYPANTFSSPFKTSSKFEPLVDDVNGFEDILDSNPTTNRDLREAFVEKLNNH